MPGNILIVGGGVVGLNCALALADARAGDAIYLIEREKFLGHHTSTRNSEVLHAGFAYPPGSNKALLCVEGNRLSFELMGRLGVSCRRGGKWIVAHGEEEARALQAMLHNARLCGVSGLREISPGELISNCPPLARPTAAAFSESSGIVDCPTYLRMLEVTLSRFSGVQIVYPCNLEGLDAVRGVASTSRGEMPFDILINAAGLFADEIYKMAGGVRNFEIYPVKGEYYAWPKGPVEDLVYPVPHRFLEVGDATKVSSMGVHLHSNIAGERFIGPTELSLPADGKTDYRIEITAEEISRRVAPLLARPPDPKELSPAFAGNRPKLYEDGKPLGDFEIFRDGAFIHLMGIESPGLTAAPAIARKVLGMLSE